MYSFIPEQKEEPISKVCCLKMVMHKSKGDVRIVGLSATIGDPELAKQWLSDEILPLSRLSQIRLNKRISVI